MFKVKESSCDKQGTFSVFRAKKEKDTTNYTLKRQISTYLRQNHTNLFDRINMNRIKNIYRNSLKSKNSIIGLL